MYISKSFCSIIPLVKNQFGQTNEIGEISEHARTFTKNLGMYHNHDYMDFDLRNFFSEDTGAFETLSDTLVDKIMLMVNVCWQKTQTTSGPVDRAQLLQDLIVIAGNNGMASVSIGTMVSDYRYYLPSWIQFRNTEDTRDNLHTVWLSDGEFRKDYDNYIIKVVPIFDRLDDFFLPAAQVKVRVDEVLVTQIIERLDDAQEGKPATHRSSETYEYHDPNNVNNRFPVPWPALIWTDIGNDADLIKDEIVQYILDRSTHTSDQWAQIFPDLFKRTEFIVAPWWNKFAQGARTLTHGVHSPVTNYLEIEPWCIKWAPNYNLTHLKANIQVVGFPFRSVVATCIGNIENRDQKHRLTDVYPDYMNLPTDDPDFNRMSLETQAWILQMGKLLALADEWTGSTQLPRGVLRVKRGNYIYLSSTINRITFLVLTKMSVNENP